jgi:SAM-dependent methyltransferase
MSDPKSTSSQVAKSWDAYWHGTGDIGAFSTGGASHPAILSFWNDFFQQINQAGDDPVMIDLASGNGAVVEGALAVFGEEKAGITCVDVSEAAIANIRSRFPDVNGVVADARSVPLDSGDFDIVTSQFGIEYAGIEAIDEAARLVAAGGWLTLLLHNSEGGIHHQCAVNLEAVTRVRESRFIPYSAEMFRTGFAAIKGADRAPYDESAGRLGPAIQDVEAVMEEYGQNVADDTIVRLYNDVGKIHSRLQHYDAEEILSWINRMEEELEAYAGRMSSMCESSIDGETFERICSGLVGQGFSIDTAGPLLAVDSDVPLAWALIANKTGKPGDTPEIGREEQKAWIKQQLDQAVHELMDRGIVESVLVEAKPAWALPLRVMIGKIREKDQAGGFDWFICGEVPTDHLHSSMAATPRDAAKHFALKWQLDAARQEDNERLAEKAEILFGFVNEDSLWQQ